MEFQFKKQENSVWSMCCVWVWNVLKFTNLKKWEHKVLIEDLNMLNSVGNLKYGISNLGRKNILILT